MGDMVITTGDIKDYIAMALDEMYITGDFAVTDLEIEDAMYGYPVLSLRLVGYGYGTGDKDGLARAIADLMGKQITLSIKREEM